MRAARSHRLALALLWLVPMVWSSNYLIARAASGVVPPHVLAFGRWAIVFVVLLCYCWRSLLAHRKRVGAEWPQLLVLGLLGMWICGAWVYIGGQSTSATNIGLIYAAAPVGIALGSHRLLGEHLSRVQALAMAMALAGVLLVIARGDPQVLLTVRFSRGDLWIVAAACCWVLYSLLLQVWPTRLTTTERLCCMSAGGLLALLPFAAFEWWSTPQWPSRQGWGLIALAGVLPGLISYSAYGHLQRELGTAKAGLMMYLQPVYAAGLAWWLLGELPQWFHLVGAVLILPSIYIATRSGRS